MLKDLVQKNRSCRRFYQEEKIPQGILEELVNLARLSPSGGNLQPLKYILSKDPEKNSQIFPCLNWAGYLKDWGGPAEGEKPSAYIIILWDKKISSQYVEYDCGIAAQTILLGAREKDLGGCMIASINRGKLREIIEIPEQYEILLVLAIGKPKEKVVIEPVGTEGDIKYWRDQKNIHHVPKRSLDELIIKSYSDLKQVTKPIKK